MNHEDTNNLIIYQAENGAIELRSDIQSETIWATQKQMSQIFDVTPQSITQHIGSIYKDGELAENRTCKESLQVQKEGARQVRRKVKEYNLDVIIAVGYRINSIVGTRFRRWATETLRKHIVKGYTINTSRIKGNLSAFLKAVEDVKRLSEKSTKVSSGDVLELVKTFAHTWFSLDSYDKEVLPQRGNVAQDNDCNTMLEGLQENLGILKQELVQKGEATELFAQEKNSDAYAGIVKNVFQSAFGQSVYPTVEEKAAHLLYFITKNHVFNDGNKRSAAFSFIWFLEQVGFDVRAIFSPDALAVLTLLVAESDPDDKDRIIGMILLVLQDKEK